jgi:hypothetical protein
MERREADGTLEELSESKLSGDGAVIKSDADSVKTQLGVVRIGLEDDVS